MCIYVQAVFGAHLKGLHNFTVNIWPQSMLIHQMPVIMKGVCDMDLQFMHTLPLAVVTVIVLKNFPTQAGH